LFQLDRSDDVLGWASGSNGQYSFDGYSAGQANLSGFGAQFPYNDPDAVTRAMSISNPNRPSLAVGMIGQDIVELPRLIKDLGDYALGRLGRPSSRMVANGYLQWQFGLKPLIGDLKTMLNFQKAVENRKKELRALRNKGLKRNARMTQRGGVTEDVTSPRYGYVAGGLYNDPTECAYLIRGRWDQWVSTRWNADASIHDISVANPGTELEAVLSASGALDGTTVWDLIPWTWLFDWFRPVGDYFGASRNTIPVKCVSACVMRSSRIVVYRIWATNPGSPIKLTFNSNMELVSKARRVFANPSPSISWNLPFLNGGQLSILAALIGARMHL
jgi:hypothetical protein